MKQRIKCRISKQLSPIIGVQWYKNRYKTVMMMQQCVVKHKYYDLKFKSVHLNACILDKGNVHIRFGRENKKNQI